MAEMRIGAELGLPNVNRGEMERAERPVEHRMVPGRDLNNKQFDQVGREMTAVKPSQAQNAYRLTGATIDFQA